MVGGENADHSRTTTTSSTTSRQNVTTTAAAAKHSLREREAWMFYQDLLPMGNNNNKADTRSSIAEDHPNRPSSFFFVVVDKFAVVLGPYPTTKALLWIVHILYFVQWRRQRRRRRRHRTAKLTFRTLVEQKRFYQWWYALLNQYHQPSLEAASLSSAANHNSTNNSTPPSNDDPNNATTNGETRHFNESSNRTNLTVEMGHAPEGPSHPRPEQSQQQHWNYYYFQQWIQRQCETHIPAAWRESVPWQRRVQLLVGIQIGMQRLVAAAGGPSLVMLLYNTHVLWSCRALEMHYATTSTSSSMSDSILVEVVVSERRNDESESERNNNNSSSFGHNHPNYDPWAYLRVLVGLAMWNTLLDVGISQCLLRFLSPSSKPPPVVPQQWDGATSNTTTTTLLSTEAVEDVDSPFMRSTRRKIRHRTLSVSLSSLTTAVLMVFGVQFQFVAPPILPWIPLERCLPFAVHPVWARLAILWALHVTFLSATGEIAWMRLGVVGNLVGVLWGSGWLDFAGTVPYWGNGVLLTAWLLTFLSCKARWPHASYLLWIDRVHWNRKGRILTPDDGDRCVEAPVLHFPVGFALSAARTNDDTSSESEDSADDDTSDIGSDSDDDEPNRAYPSIEDNEIYGRIPSLSFMETGTGEGEVSRLLVAQSSSTRPTASSRVRSRRTGPSILPDAEDWDR